MPGASPCARATCESSTRPVDEVEQAHLLCYPPTVASSSRDPPGCAAFLAAAPPLTDGHSPMRSLTSALRVLLLPTLIALPLAATLAATEAPAHADDTGMLRVTAPVQGAVVYVDNELLGDAPITTYVAQGSHTVRVAADHYDPFVRRVNISRGRTTELAADLLPGGGTVEFVVDPAGAVLTLNGRDEYPTPVRLRQLEPGTYKWHLEAPAHEPDDGEFDFQPGKNLLLVEQLESSSGRFSVTSRPEGAEVFLDGRGVGQTPVQLEGIDPGMHQVLLDMKGYATILRTVDTTDGSKGVVNVRLSESGAGLTVKTNDNDATVRLNGVQVGAGRSVRLPELERGRYTLSVSAPGAQSVEARIEIPETGGAWWKAKLSDDRAELKAYTPLTRSWAFWAGAGAVAAAGTTGGIIAYNATIPDPIPAGDIVVDVP